MLKKQEDKVMKTLHKPIPKYLDFTAAKVTEIISFLIDIYTKCSFSHA